MELTGLQLSSRPAPVVVPPGSVTGLAPHTALSAMPDSSTTTSSAPRLMPERDPEPATTVPPELVPAAGAPTALPAVLPSSVPLVP